MSKTRSKIYLRQSSFARSLIFATTLLFGMAAIIPPPTQPVKPTQIQTTVTTPIISKFQPLVGLGQDAPSNIKTIGAPLTHTSITQTRSSAVMPTTISTYPGLPVYPHAQYKYRTLATPAGALYPLEPFLGRISAAAGWDSRRAGHPAPTVAVIDTGFALDHDNFVNRWAINSAEIRGSSVDNDADGYIGNWRGWDFVHNLPDPAAGRDNPTASSATHGTMTAGLAGLVNNEAKILPLQALDDNGTGYTDEIAAAVRYAADHGAKVISLSLGSNSDDPYLHDQIDYAISKGTVIVAAAGNSGCDCLLYPAAYQGVVAVGASTASDNRASFSSYGSNLDVLAPGTAGDVCSSYYPGTVDTSQYSCGFSGTSFAAPIVAGLAALLIQQEPSATNINITNAITLSADKIPSMLDAYKTLKAGYGRINIGRAITTITMLISAPNQLMNSQKVFDIASNTTATGTGNATYCVSLPGALCDFKLVSKFGTVGIGQHLLDPVSGSTTFVWDPAGLGLTPGQWQSIITVSTGTTTISIQGDSILVAP